MMQLIEIPSLKRSSSETRLGGSSLSVFPP
jgi:hypothetical protein